MERLRELQEARKLKSVHIRTSPNSETSRLGCGCVFKRISTANCKYGGTEHPFMVIAPTKEDGPQLLEALGQFLKQYGSKIDGQ